MTENQGGGRGAGYRTRGRSPRPRSRPFTLLFNFNNALRSEGWRGRSRSVDPRSGWGWLPPRSNRLICFQTNVFGNRFPVVVCDFPYSDRVRHANQTKGSRRCGVGLVGRGRLTVTLERSCGASSVGYTPSVTRGTEQLPPTKEREL